MKSSTHSTLFLSPYQFAKTTSDAPAIDVSPIETIHRGGDGLVSLHTSVVACGKPWMDLGMVPLGDIAMGIRRWPTILAEDTYFSINTMFRSHRQFERLKDGTTMQFRHPITDLEMGLRRASNLRWLNACYADLDFHSSTGDFTTLISDLRIAIAAKVIPEPSIVTRSGRGAWIFFLLEDSSKPGFPQRAWPEKVAVYCQIQGALVARLAKLGADPLCKDPARVTRIPGSVNSKAEAGFRRVIYWVNSDSQGGLPTYTLHQLAAWFEVNAKIRQNSYKRGQLFVGRSKSADIDPAVSRGKRRAAEMRWQYGLEEFAVLRTLRKSFIKGCRSRAVLLYCILLRRNHVAEREIEREAIILGQQCRPPLPHRKILGTFRDSLRYKTANLRHATCGKWLDVTDAERKQLTRWFPTKIQRTRPLAAERLNLIRDELSRLNCVPSLSEMKCLLAAQGVVISRAQLSLDYKKLAVFRKSKPSPCRAGGSTSFRHHGLKARRNQSPLT